MNEDRPKTLSEQYTEIFRRLHMIVPLALLVPLAALIPKAGMDPAAAAAADGRLTAVYLSALLLVIPGALMHFAQTRISRFTLFVLTGMILIMGGMTGAHCVGRLTGLTMKGAIYPPDLMILLLFFFDAMSIRYNENSRIRSKREGDLSWTQDSKLLPGPSWFAFIWIAGIYILSLFVHSAGLGNAALAAAVMYYFLYIPYLAFRGRTAYLDNRKHVRGVPAGRIRNLMNRQLLRVLIPSALFAVIAVLTAGGRHFLDIPSFGPLPDESAVSSGIMGQRFIMEELMRLMAEEEGAPPPAWVVKLFSFIENMVTVLCIALLVFIIVRLLMHAAALFRGIEKESREVRFEGDSDEHISLRRFSPSRFGYPSGIRRRYRKTILHYRPEAPGISETPSEIETLAGLPDSEDMKSLHAEYEKVRYGRD